MSLRDRARSRLNASSGREDLHALHRRLDLLEEAQAENETLESATVADLDALVDSLIARVEGHLA